MNKAGKSTSLERTRTPKEKAVVPQKVTPPPAPCDTKEIKINIQNVAIEALASGESITNAAHMAGIRRETLSRWLNSNPVFIAMLNKKKNEVRNESITSINTIVAQAANALKIALCHPDINPTAVVQSIMSMLPKMYAALIAQGEAETDPFNVHLNMEGKKLLTMCDYLKFPEQGHELSEKYEKLYKKVMEFDIANEDSSVSRDKVLKLAFEITEMQKGWTGIQYSINRDKLGI